MVDTAAILASIILSGLSVFQAFLIAGAPYGKYAWGGENTVLPKKLRFSSIFSILLYLLFAFTILSKAGVISAGASPLIGISMWIFTTYFFIGIFMNGISRSKSERAVMTPLATVLAACFLYVAAS